MIPTPLLETKLRELIQAALTAIVGSAANGASTVVLEIPRTRAHGDLSSSVALQWASSAGLPPLQLAQSIAESLQRLLEESPVKETIQKIEIKPPGFVNFFFSHKYLCSVLQEVVAGGSGYGRSSLGQGRKAIVEFVSANPTGPLSVAHGRQAAVGDALSNILDFVGYQVHREYYLNDEGTQIDLLGESVLARAREKLNLPFQFPENGYKGLYIVDSAGKLIETKGPEVIKGPHASEDAKKFAVEELTQVIRGELDQFGVRFDTWFPQSSLEDRDYLQQSLEELKRRGYLYESEGAWWLKSTAFGDDKDRVVIRSDGRLTYIAADIAYHRKKFERGFKLLVNLWGPDHHGYIPRLKAAVQALGFPPEALQIRIVQLCTLKRGAETIPMSTREGQFITLTQVMNEVGCDAARFFFLLRKSDAHLEFDLELAKQHSLENPVYYIQYAHARICSILGYQKQQKATLSDSAVQSSLLAAAEELAILRLLREFPGTVEACAKSLESFGIISFLQTLAESFHRFYDVHRVVSDDAALTAARLQLVKGVHIVLATGLRLLGVSAPEKM